MADSCVDGFRMCSRVEKLFLKKRIFFDCFRIKSDGDLKVSNRVLFEM